MTERKTNDNTGAKRPPKFPRLNTAKKSSRQSLELKNK